MVLGWALILRHTNVECRLSLRLHQIQTNSQNEESLSLTLGYMQEILVLDGRSDHLNLGTWKNYAKEFPNWQLLLRK